jgi:hypothetical protein
MVSAIVATVGVPPSLWRSFSINKKREIIKAVNTIVATGISCCKACSRVVLSHVYYKHFQKAIKKDEALEIGDAFVSYKIM